MDDCRPWRTLGGGKGLMMNGVLTLVQDCLRLWDEVIITKIEPGFLPVSCSVIWREGTKEQFQLPPRAGLYEVVPLTGMVLTLLPTRD